MIEFSKEFFQILTFEIFFLCCGILIGLYIAERYNIKIIEELKTLFTKMNDDGEKQK